MKVRWLTLVLICIILSACGSPATETVTESATSTVPAPEPVQITVFAASSLTDVFTELAAEFTVRDAGIEVLLNFAGSTQLAAQLSEGAVADVFASANATQMQVAIDAGRITAGTEALFVTNRLTIIVPADNPAGIEALEDLTEPGIALILAVEGVPVRDYTDEIVAAMLADFQEGFYANLVSEEENVRQVAAKIALGEADAGIVYTSDVTPDIASQVLEIAIPDEQNAIAAYPIAPVSDSANAETAQAFIEFVLSADGQAILARWGFGPLPGE